MSTECKICLANSNEKRISPGVPIYENGDWVLEHAYPSSLKGWLVIVFKRHCERLDSLTKVEWRSLGDIQFFATKALSNSFKLEKEYVCCFAEMEGFKHIHFHVIPKPINCDLESVGVKAFRHIKPDAENIISEDEVKEICKNLKTEIEEILRVSEA